MAKMVGKAGLARQSLEANNGAALAFFIDGARRCNPIARTWIVGTANLQLRYFECSREDIGHIKATVASFSSL
ncbi:hypothetical protein [Mesorhizobium sp. M2E.F.Ca.ET.154.01.1.1]|uniref:hypothetical protein n=1 Tax=Mesorhizobium sp. M2E.F.Ca.ET.154.01.1.1 TaxID=2500521 RepID=UPI000FD6F4C6|nr:hypothetical protein [Mesorhizobium sp. M2E.F.Ca.ET.154.01.1.1]TGT71758.1 hypothetical protein EN809_016370 [Mesorhizobium sp. M2E.F.Ca.ET.166.01.1.1]TGV99528.1 hypothetical protein EN797_024885 [Mesorhizobium sp. M2E.F.Ca.ET.154.01.1.1]